MITGLTKEQVQSRLQAGLTNAVTAKAGLSGWQIILRHTVTFFNFLFLLLAVILALCGSGVHNMTFLMVAFFNTVIGCVQQLRAKWAVDRLRLIAAQKVWVLRDGEKCQVRHDLLVQDDVVWFSAGDQICADGRVVAGSLQANESLITGEADPVDKQIGDRVYSGSFVLAGSAAVRLTAVGNDSFAAKLSLEAKKNPRAAKPEMMKTLDKLIRVLGIALVPVGLILFYHQFQILNMGLQQSAEATVAAVVGMIPEGLYLLTSVALAVSAIKLSRQRVLVQDMGCIETLARVDVLCVDKTGTITEPEMEVAQLIPLGERAEEEIAEILGALFDSKTPQNDTGRAIFRRYGGKAEGKCTEFIPFSPERGWCGGVLEDRGSYLIGAPDRLLSAEDPACKTAGEKQTEGFRVLAICSVRGDIRQFESGSIAPLALLLLTNPIRSAAAETFAYFAEQGVTVKVISGDSAVTASGVARQAGIPGAERYIDIAALNTDADYRRAVAEYTVFGRVRPEQKKRLIAALQENGHTVAMTGDGVNDVLAMRQADCAVAMASGAQAASQVAQLVLMDSDFSGLPDIVKEGRRVINNIKRAAALFLVKNILSFGLAILTVIVGLQYPFDPIHLTIISALTIGAPSFLLALEPNYARVQGRFLPGVLRQALPGGLTNIAVVLLAQIFAKVFKLPMTDLHTVCTGILAMVGLLVLYRVCRPLDGYRGAILGLMAAGLVGCFLVLGRLFDLYITQGKAYLVLMVMLLAALTVFVLMQALFRWTDKLFARIKR